MIEILIHTTSPNKTIKYINNLKINIYNIRYQKKSIILKINHKDLEKINKFYDTKIINLYGVSKIKEYSKKNKIPILYFFIIILLIFLFTRITIDIEIITQNSKLHSYLQNELYKNDISKYSIIKNNNKLNKIKEKILKDSKDSIEWLNIKRVGMKYIINVEQKIEKNKIKSETYCNIISTKNALISKIITHKGEEKVDINDSVKKGDVLISGDIKFNEQTKKQVCADGIVYGKTWYTITISTPIKYEKIIKKNKIRYNVLIKKNNHKYKIFKPRLKEYIEQNKKIINIFGLEIYLQKEIMISKSTQKYNNDELEKNIETKIKETLKHTLKGKYKIIERKVLKKQQKNSKIEMEIFIVAEEQISKISKDATNNIKE